MFILPAVGTLIGVWNLSGTIPKLVYYGIQVLTPNWYYAATAVICGLIGMNIGSSWPTAGTIGVGLVSVADMLGVSTVGAVSSSACGQRSGHGEGAGAVPGAAEVRIAAGTLLQTLAGPA
ncbi:hypothetical protein OG758_46560 [Streptomyces sp. NBC_01474]|uniref:hypothetical protein n=1 Tax=Streptomyces sp. NBC_01474 TaxID=2903880 RepID=UPI002DDADD22|nr:hypothetical protein [Streptomyces sp. NBC_01474]WSE00961.1 hypothetical protein OG758_46560 [Streptomyces sp. NBC_01474]